MHGCPHAFCGERRSLPTERCCNASGLDASKPNICFLPPFAASLARYHFVLLSKHEGAFYPASVAEAVLDTLRAATEGGMHDAIAATADRYCPEPGGSRLVAPLEHSHYFLEEVAMQTWAANQLSRGSCRPPDGRVPAGPMTRFAYDAWFGRPVAAATSRSRFPCGKLRFWLETEGIYATKIHTLNQANDEGAHQRAALAACFPPEGHSSPPCTSDECFTVWRNESGLALPRRRGYCARGREDVGDCDAGLVGSRRGVGHIDECIELCRTCCRCHYVSFSTQHESCSWHTSCPAFHGGMPSVTAERPPQLEDDFEMVQVRVKKVRGPCGEPRADPSP